MACSRFPDHRKYDHCSFRTFLRIWYARNHSLSDADSRHRRSSFLRRFGYGAFICTEQIQNDTLRSAKLNIRRSESPPATADAASCICGTRSQHFPADAFFLSDLFTVCDKAVSVRFKVITRIIHAHLGYRSAHRIEDDRIEFIVSHDQYCISII